MTRLARDTLWLHTLLIFFVLNTSHAKPLSLTYRSLKPKRPCSDIQKMIDDHPPGEQIISYIYGKYRCEQPIIIDRDNVMLISVGKYGTALTLADNANSPVIIIGNPHTPIQERRRNIVLVGPIDINGNMDNQRYECWGGKCDSNEQTTIRNNGITVRGVDDILITGVTVHHAISGGIVTEKESRGVIILNSTASENFYDGFAGCQTEKSILCGIRATHNHAAGLSFDIAYSNNTICDAHIEDNLETGIFVRNSFNNHFFDIHILRSGKYGIFLTLYSLYEARDIRSMVDTCPSGNIFEYIVVLQSGKYGWFNSNLCLGNIFRDAGHSLESKHSRQKHTSKSSHR